MNWDIFSKLKKKHNFNCLLITPPLLEADSVYSAMPILAGQLLKHGYEAKNLDLNIKFYRTIFTEKFLKKIQKNLDSKKINYDKKKIKNLIKNTDKIVDDFRTNNDNSEDHKNANDKLKEIMKFISLNYKDFHLEMNNTSNCFRNFDYSYENINNITIDREKNIFVEFFKKKVREIQKQKPDIIGITVPFIGAFIPALTLARILKKETDAYIVFGGSFLLQDEIANFPNFFEIYGNAVLIKDGEESIVELIKNVKQGQEPKNVNGILFKNSQGEIVFNAPKLVTKMNEIANMSYDGLDLDEYMKKNPNIDVIISKGCYWGKCEFCSLAPKYKRYRIKTPQKVVADIKELKEKYPQIGLVRFQDDALHPIYLDKLADEIIKENLNINYFIFGRLEKEFTKNLFQKLAKSGLCGMFWGLESGCQSVLNKMNKGISLEFVEEILQNAYEAGVHGGVGIIVNYPTETIEEFNETLNFISRIKKYVEICPGQFTVMKNSTIEQKCEEFNIKVLKHNIFCYASDWEDLSISQDERQRRWDYFIQAIQQDDYNFKIYKSED